MSLGYQFQPIDVTIEGHPKAWAAGVEAMGLWLWGMVHARAHKTGGRLGRAAVLGAWGGKRNIMLAKRLVDAGLWLLNEDGSWSIWNFDSKSAGSSEKAKSTDRVKRFRERSRNADETRCSETSASSSISVSSSVSDLEIASPAVEFNPESTGVRVKPPQGDGMPGWFDGACDATAMVIGGDITDRPALWVQYLASRRRKTWAMDHTDAVGWLTPVVRSERSKARASPGKALVQSADNRAWKLPEGGEF